MKKILVLICVVSLMAVMMISCKSNETSENVLEENTTTEASKEVKEVEEEENKNGAGQEQASVVIGGTVSVSRILHGLGVEMIGIPTTKKFLPEELKGITEIGMAMAPDLEIIKSLEATHFITDSSLKDRLGVELEAQEIPVKYMKTSGYEDIINTIEELGKEFGKSEEALTMVNDIRAYEKEAKVLIEDEEALSVAIIFGTPKSFMLATNNSYIGSLVTMAGSVNITADMDGAMAPFVPFSLEVLAQKNPDVILRLTHVNPEQSKVMFDKEFDENAFYEALKAVQNDKVFDLDNSLFGVVATVDCGEAFVEIAKLIYGK